jgi:transglutaminase-like putative cysteine protease/predicted Zn-dependent protease
MDVSSSTQQGPGPLEFLRRAAPGNALGAGRARTVAGAHAGRGRGRTLGAPTRRLSSPAVLPLLLAAAWLLPGATSPPPGGAGVAARRSATAVAAAPAPRSSSDGRRSHRSGSSAGTAGTAATAGPAAAGKDAPPAAGPEPWEGEPFSADPAAVAQAAARFAGHDGEPVVMLLSDQRYSLDGAGRETYTQRLVYRILSTGADGSWSTVERSWSPWHQARPEVRARVITPEGVAHALDPAILTEGGEVQDGPDMFGDGRVLRGPLPATGPGVVVEQEVTVRDTAPFFDSGIVEVADVTASVWAHHVRIVLEAPASTPLRYVTRLLPAATPREELIAAGKRAGDVSDKGGKGDQDDTGDHTRRLTFDWRDLPAEDAAETGLPPDVPRNPYLAFSTGRSWTDIARRYSAIVDQAIRGADLAAWIRAAGGPGPSQLETMNRLLARLGEIRYTGVELGQGGLVPRTPAETLRRRFGDCKDKTVLLIAALRALDIPAYAALLNAGDDQQDVEQELPGFGGFNHAIVVVPGTPSIWIDPTDRFARAGELPTDDQGRLALIASATATGLIRTPEAEAAENRSVKTREFFLADLGTARAVETDEYSGATERDLRAFYVSEDPETLRDAVSDYMRKTYLAKDLAAYDHANPLDLSHPFRLRFETRDTKRAVTDEKAAAVAILPAALFDQLPDEITSEDRDRQGQPRLADYYFSRPFTAEAVYRIVPPPGFAPQPLPPKRVRHLGPATLSEEYTAGGGGTVTASLKLASGKRRISPGELDQLRAGVRELAAAKPVVVQFAQVGEANLAAGRVREAIEEFQREAAAAPKKALPHCRLARALLAGGLGEAARQEADRAVRLEPRAAVAQRTLAWVLQHDGLGRRFGAGFDRAGAIAAYRRARSLDADDEATRADLAILLEHDVQGRRYAAGADLGAAIAEYQALRKDLKSKAMDDNLLVALLRAGRFAEVTELAAEIEDTAQRDALRLAAAAATSGPEAAVREAERRLWDPAAEVSALDAAAQELVAMRRYGEAAALLARAGQLSPNAAAFLARADALRRARRHEEAQLPDADPASAAKRFLLAALAEPPATDRMLRLLSRGLAESLTPAARRELVEAPARGLRTSRAAAQHEGLSADVRQDLVLAAWRATVQGDDQAGFRVEISSAVGERPGRSAFFVVREGGGYRIAGLGDAPATLGLEALRRVAAGDLRGARQWLDWADEELQVPGTLGAAGGDEVPSVPLLALWGHRSPAGGETADEFRCAAASLASIGATDAMDAAGAMDAMGPSDAMSTPGAIGPVATSGLAAPGGESLLTTLRSCRDRAGEGDSRRLAFDVALAGAYRGLGRFQDLLATAGALAAARPDSAAAFAWQARALAGLARWAELGALAERRLQAHPEDPLALRTAAHAAARRGDLDTATALLRRVADSGRESAADLNELAWLALVRGRPDDQAVEDAQRAATLSGYRDAASLHTLASLYVERGRPAEAYRIVVQSIEARPGAAAATAAEPDAGDWYVFGHLAESYGLPEVARRLYARVRPGKLEELDPFSTFRLAQARLAALGAVKEAAAAKGGHGGR